jgi:hypothetical protein
LCFFVRMDDTDLVAFTPVPVRSRRDGWTPRRQYFFILALARGHSATKAAALLGMTRKTAYELRAKPGGEGFADAWAAAVARARTRRIAAQRPSLAERALEGEWHPRLYRGQLIGWEQRPANARAMGLLKRLDRRVERLSAGTPSAGCGRGETLLPPESDNDDNDGRIGRQVRHLPPRRRA